MSLLEKIPKNQNFKVPDEYFETFSDRLHDRISSEKPVSIITRFWQVVKPQLAMATLMAGFLLLTFVGIRNFIPGNTSESFTIQVADMIEDQIYYFDESLIVDVYLMESQNIVNPDGSMDPELIDEIIDYLTDDPNFETLVDDF